MEVVVFNTLRSLYPQGLVIRQLVEKTGVPPHLLKLILDKLESHMVIASAVTEPDARNSRRIYYYRKPR